MDQKPPLKWTDPAPPNDSCPYDHITADSPLGKFRIEWKSWKKYDSYVLFLGEDYLGPFSDLDSAKGGALKFLKDRLDELQKLLFVKSSSKEMDSIPDAASLLDSSNFQTDIYYDVVTNPLTVPVNPFWPKDEVSIASIQKSIIFARAIAIRVLEKHGSVTMSSQLAEIKEKLKKIHEDKIKLLEENSNLWAGIHTLRAESTTSAGVPWKDAALEERKKRVQLEVELKQYQDLGSARI